MGILYCLTVGEPLHLLAVESVRHFYTLTKGRVPIVGCGGIHDGRSAYNMIRAGASCVQLYTAMVYQGYPVVNKVGVDGVVVREVDGHARGGGSIINGGVAGET